MLISSIVEHLLRREIIRWPGGHVSLEILDDWRGHRGHRWLIEGSYRRVATLDATNTVTSTGTRVVNPRFGIGSRDDFHRNLEAGLCTHDVVREILTAVLRKPDLRPPVIELLNAFATHLVVDEVFDANNLDISIVYLASEAGIAVTLVGDPWQALYRFRGARPELVPELIERFGFASLALSESFRFRTDEMIDLADNLRAGQPVDLTDGEDHDVVLASQWDHLWNGPDHVLPISFGRTTNKTDAAAIVLLDHLVHASFSRRAIFLPEALILLDLDRDTYRIEGPAVLKGVVEILVSSDSNAPAKALAALRAAVKELGAPRRPPTGSGDAEQRQVNRLAALAARLRSDRPLIPGMTIHQAKGREWNHVGVRLTPGERSRLTDGLDQSSETDRALYVALTRARDRVSLAA
jgi:DNA helicase II / ATP-dependent DNA helicase PcrA